MQGDELHDNMLYATYAMLFIWPRQRLFIDDSNDNDDEEHEDALS